MTAAPAVWPEEGLEAVGSCPLCGTAVRRLLYEGLTDRLFFCAPGSWTLYGCESCGGAYLDPRPSDETIHLAYGDYYTHAASAEAPPTGLRKARRALRNGYLNRRYGYELAPAWPWGAFVMALLRRRREAADRWARRLERPRGRPRLLDVGCGNGEFLAAMRDAGWHVQGLEPDAAAAAVAERAGLAVERSVLAATRLPADHFDAVTASHVIEHLADPLAALKTCQSLLRPDGVLSLTTPNLASRRHSERGRDWDGLDAPRHLVLFTPESLARAVEAAGFRITFMSGATDEELAVVARKR